MPDAFQLPRFYPIVDTDALAARQWPALAFSEALLTAGVRILQYRHKDSWTQRHFDEAKEIAALAKQAGALFVVNDRADFASLLGAGVHLGQNDLPPVAARKIVADGVMGFSTHNELQLKRANDEPVQYLALGPIFATTSKLQPDPVVGLDGLRALRPLTRKPLVAIGGIILENVPSVFEAGADAVATVAGILAADLHSVQRLGEEWLHQTR